MTAEERLDEVARILATGFLRLQAKKANKNKDLDQPVSRNLKSPAKVDLNMVLHVARKSQLQSN